MRANKLLVILGAVFGGIGLVAAAVGFTLYVEQARFRALAQRTEGEIVGVPGGRPRYRFEAEGRTHEVEGSISSSPPVYKRGDRVTVLYKPGDPDDARIDAFLEMHFGTMMGGIFAAAFGLPGGILLGIAIVGRRRRERALRLGTAVEAKVTGMRIVHNVRMNRRSPWVIEAEYEDRPMGVTYRFESHYVWDDPTAHYPPGATVTVFYMPDAPGTYAFKLDRMPGEG